MQASTDQGFLKASCRRFLTMAYASWKAADFEVYRFGSLSHGEDDRRVRWDAAEAMERAGHKDTIHPTENVLVDADRICAELSLKHNAHVQVHPDSRSFVLSILELKYPELFPDG